MYLVLYMLLHFSTHAYLFSPEKGSCYVFSTRNNCCVFLAFYGVIFQSVIEPFFKTPVLGAPLLSDCIECSDIKYKLKT